VRSKVVKPVIGGHAITKVKIILGCRIPGWRGLCRKEEVLGTGNNRRGLVAPAGLEGEDLTLGGAVTGYSSDRANTYEHQDDCTTYLDQSWFRHPVQFHLLFIIPGP
jgi:hypothetical protein